MAIDSASIFGRGVSLPRDNFNDHLPNDTEASWRGGANIRPAIFLASTVTAGEDLIKLESDGVTLHYAKPGMMTFCGLDLRLDPKVPRDEVWLEKDGAVVGKITGVTLPAGVQGTTVIGEWR